MISLRFTFSQSKGIITRVPFPSPAPLQLLFGFQPPPLQFVQNARSAFQLGQRGQMLADIRPVELSRLPDHDSFHIQPIFGPGRKGFKYDQTLWPLKTSVAARQVPMLALAHVAGRDSPPARTKAPRHARSPTRAILVFGWPPAPELHYATSAPNAGHWRFVRASSLQGRTFLNSHEYLSKPANPEQNHLLPREPEQTLN